MLYRLKRSGVVARGAVFDWASELFYERGRPQRTVQQTAQAECTKSPSQPKQWQTANIGGCWRTAEDEMGAWIKKGRGQVADRLQGTITNLEVAALWAESEALAK